MLGIDSASSLLPAPALEVSAVHEVTLEGWEAFDAAVHCAAISAGQRVPHGQQQPTQRKPSSSDGSSGRTPGRLRRLFSRSQAS